MSWFDTAGLASFAKSALKEAQKTLDKALDIKDDVLEGDVGEEKNEADSSAQEVKGAGDGVVVKAKDATGQVMSETSVWGSFTGSYFDVGHTRKPDAPLFPNGVVPGPAPLATPETELTPIDNTGFPSKFSTADEIHRVRSETTQKADNVISHGKDAPFTDALAGGDQSEEKVSIRANKVRRNSANRNSTVSNRLSVVSTESERKSSESVEVLGSAATSPDSVASISASSSMGPVSPSCTDSVEVIDSLASPSSVEVILESVESLEVISREVTSPGYSTDSVEVIEELEDDLSVAESYTSVSESTGTTMLSHLHRMTDSCQDSCQDLSQASSRLRSGASTPDVLRLSLPSHGSCDLLSESIQEADWESPELSQVDLPRSHHGSPIRRLLSRSEERISGKLEVSRERLTRSEVAPPTAAQRAMDDSTQSDSQSDSRTIVDSSCEGTLIGSSDDDGTTVGESVVPGGGDRKEGTSSSSSSVYMKELLAEAIDEDPLTRETSPTLSEKSRSDAVKLGSEATSGHTSGDELETTTSSDIEIISRYSPNGDSSSTASRHSPAKLQPQRHKLSLVSVDLLGRAAHGKVRGHHREPSEASSGCSEENPSEAERLSKKIMELTEVLEAREAKLVELSRSNLEMQEKNLALKKQLETASSPLDTERDKDELIRDLREEGEKLSKLQLKQSNLIKTLRKQEQSQQLAVASYKKQLDSLTQEMEGARKRLSSKEELERGQVEKIGLLTGKVGRQDLEIATLLDQLEQAVIKAEQLRIHLDSVQLEVESKRTAMATLERELADATQTVETAKRERERMRERDRERDALASQLDELRLLLKQRDQLTSQREAQAREEKKSLLRRLEEAEGRNEELAQSVSISTRPLLRQLDQLQANSNQQRDSWERRERELLDRLEEALAHQHAAQETDRAAKHEISSLRSRLSSLEANLQKANEEAGKAALTQDQLLAQTAALREETQRFTVALQTEVDALRAQLADARRELALVEAALATANQKLAQQTREGERLREVEHVSPAPSSPTLSFGRMSMSGSESWPQFADDAFETSSIGGRNLYDSVRGGSSTLLEGLQAQLKMRDGEALQQQWETQRRDAERSALTSELTAMSARVAQLEEALAQARRLEAPLAELQGNYDALLQMHGEKVEEVEELRLDLQDVKDMYKAQIDQLLQKNSNREEAPG